MGRTNRSPAAPALRRSILTSPRPHISLSSTIRTWVTRGGGSESLRVGTGSDPLTYNSVETIDATTSGNEHFILGAGFGRETIKGFVTSGTSSDTIQLAKSAFSYLTPGMTQAQDLAAVLTFGGATSSSGLTISDSHGDSLTLAGVTPSMIAANPGMFAFT